MPRERRRHTHEVGPGSCGERSSPDERSTSGSRSLETAKEIQAVVFGAGPARWRR